MRIKLFWIFGIITLVLIIASYLLVVNKVFATQVDNCTYTCPTVHFEWYRCPSGYTEHDGQCRKWSVWHYVYASKVLHTADVEYEKSQDPNHCHRPSDDTLKDVYGMDHDARSDFKKDNSELKDSIAVCVTPTCTPTPEVTPTPTETPKDYCDTLEGVQSEEDSCPKEEEPTPTPEVRHEDPGLPEGPFLANTCTGQAGPVIAGSNFHVYRNGSMAQAKWTPGDGSEAQIYYREVGMTDWPFAWAGSNSGDVLIDHLKPNVGYDFVLYTNNHCSNGLKAGEFVNDGPQAKLFKSLGVIAF